MRGAKFVVENGLLTPKTLEHQDLAMDSLSDVARWLRFRNLDRYNDACALTPDEVRRRLRTYR